MFMQLPLQQNQIDNKDSLSHLQLYLKLSYPQLNLPKKAPRSTHQLDSQDSLSNLSFPQPLRATL